MPARYLAVPAIPAELGWVVVRAHDKVMVQFGDGYMSEDIAEARAATLNAGRPGTDIPNV